MEEIKKIELITEIEADNKTVLFNHIQENEADFEEVKLTIEELDNKLQNIQLTPGERGEKGDKGETGERGESGRDGIDGKDGINGVDGVNGLDGKDGEKGDKGDTGEKGDKPKHRWKATKLQFEKPDGTWGQLVDLRGLQGQIGLQGGSLGASYPSVHLNNELLTTGVRDLNFSGGITATVTGTKVDISTDDLSGYVPYTGATTDVDLGAFGLISSTNARLSLESTGVHIGFHDSGAGTSTNVPLFLYDNYGSAVKIMTKNMVNSSGYNLYTPDPSIVSEEFTLITGAGTNKQVAVFDDTNDIASSASLGFNTAANTLTVGDASVQGAIGLVNSTRTTTLKAGALTATLTFPAALPASTAVMSMTNAGVMSTIATTGSVNVVLSTSPTITTPNVTTSIVLTRTALASTPNYGLYLRNTTSSTAGSPAQFSPAIQFFGSGWDTGAGGFSEGRTAMIYMSTATGADVTSTIRFDMDEAGGGSDTKMYLRNNGCLGLDGASGPNAKISIGGNGTTSCGLYVGGTDYSNGQITIADSSNENFFRATGTVSGATYFVGLGDLDDAYSYCSLAVTYNKVKIYYGDLEISSDSNKIFLGAGSDMTAYYNGTAGYITTNDVAPSDLNISCGTDKTLVLTETVWDDLRITSAGFDRAGVADPSLVSYTPTGSSIATFLYEFQKDDIAYFTAQLPHGYKEGTDIRVHVHWTPGLRGNEESGATVGWKVDYCWANIDGTFGAMGTADLSDACDGTDDKHQMTPSVTITGSGKNISSMLLCNIRRTDTGADDTWAGTASGELPMILEIDFHYEIDTLGSRQTGIK